MGTLPLLDLAAGQRTGYTPSPSARGPHVFKIGPCWGCQACATDKGTVALKRARAFTGPEDKARYDDVAFLVRYQADRTVRGRLVFKRCPVGDESIRVIGSDEVIPVAPHEPFRLFIQITGVEPGAELAELSAPKRIGHGFGNGRIRHEHL